MTPQAIRSAIEASPDLLALAAQGDTQAIAGALSVGRTKTVPTEVGNGTVLEALGFATGNALLDVLYSAPDFRHVKPLLEQGRLRLDSPMAAAALGSLVPAVLTTEHVAALLSHAKVADPVAELDVRRAIFADDGALLVGA